MALLATGDQLAKEPSIQNAMFRLRHELFHKKLKWAVNSVDGLEVDQFDRADTVYILHMENDQILGCCRLLPTTQPYMLSEVFYEIAEGYIPRAEHVWEVSRYCIDERLVTDMNMFEYVSASLLCTLCEFALEQGVTELAAEMHPGLVDNAVHLYGLPHIRQKPKKFGNDDVQICHYRPAFANIRRQAAECFGIELPATESLAE